jgi:RNA recognition motif-containing protein
LATKSLYVGNLSYSTTESALLEAFAPYGASSVRIVEGRGFGFVDIDADKMEAAIADKHNSRLDGRTLTVNEARPREAGGGGGGGNRGGGGGGYGGGGGGNRGGGGYGGGRGGGKRW